VIFVEIRPLSSTIQISSMIQINAASVLARQAGIGWDAGRHILELLT